jgi:hypothetical protein
MVRARVGSARICEFFGGQDPDPGDAGNQTGGLPVH